MWADEKERGEEERDRARTRRGPGVERTNGIFVAELEAQAEGVVRVDGVGSVEDLNVHVPFLEVWGRGESYAWGQVFVNLLLGT